MSTKILVVDDDPDILEGISIILETEGYTVATNSEGEKTYERIKKFNPDLILLDVLMSGSDGRTICKNLKSKANTKKIPVIMISADPGAKSGSLKAGANEFISKPFEIDDLINAIRKFTVSDKN